MVLPGLSHDNDPGRASDRRGTIRRRYHRHRRPDCSGDRWRAIEWLVITETRTDRRSGLALIDHQFDLSRSVFSGSEATARPAGLRWAPHGRAVLRPGGRQLRGRVVRTVLLFRDHSGRDDGSNSTREGDPLVNEPNHVGQIPGATPISPVAGRVLTPILTTRRTSPWPSPIPASTSLEALTGPGGARRAGGILGSWLRLGSRRWVGGGQLRRCAVALVVVAE